MDHTSIREHGSTRPRTGAPQAVRGLRTWSASPVGARSTGLIRASFSLARPVAAVTVWVQSSDGFDVLTYRHFTAARPAVDWDVTMPDLPAGTYDVIVDVPATGDGSRESWSGQVTV